MLMLAGKRIVPFTGGAKRRQASWYIAKIHQKWLHRGKERERQLTIQGSCHNHQLQNCQHHTQRFAHSPGKCFWGRKGKGKNERHFSKARAVSKLSKAQCNWRGWLAWIVTYCFCRFNVLNTLSNYIYNYMYARVHVACSLWRTHRYDVVVFPVPVLPICFQILVILSIRTHYISTNTNPEIMAQVWLWPGNTDFYIYIIH